MSAAEDNGGSAFPTVPVNSDEPERYAGMSLRDYFAGQALMGLIASDDEDAGDRIEDIPKYAYFIADAMLKARKSPEQPS